MDAFLYTAVAFYDVEASQIQRIGCQPDDRRTLLYHTVVANPVRGLLNREKRTKREVWHPPPPPPPTLLGRYGGIKIKAHGARNEENKTKM